MQEISFDIQSFQRMVISGSILLQTADAIANNTVQPEIPEPTSTGSGEKKDAVIAHGVTFESSNHQNMFILA